MKTTTSVSENVKTMSEKSKIIYNKAFSSDGQSFVFYDCMADYIEKLAQEYGNENGAKFNFTFSSQPIRTPKSNHLM